MGEEFDFTKGFLITDKSGKTMSFSGLSEATFLTETFKNAIAKADEEIARINPNEVMSFDVYGKLSKESYFLLALAYPRLVRRAFRWEEKLRRMRLKGDNDIPEDRLWLAVQKTRFAENNRKPEKQKIWNCVISVQKVDVQ